MHKDNPACYECPKQSGRQDQGVHHWFVRDGVAECQKCKLRLSKADTADLRR
jgi:hypothetical protein